MGTEKVLFRSGSKRSKKEEINWFYHRVWNSKDGISELVDYYRTQFFSKNWNWKIYIQKPPNTQTARWRNEIIKRQDIILVGWNFGITQSVEFEYNNISEIDKLVLQYRFFSYLLNQTNSIDKKNNLSIIITTILNKIKELYECKYYEEKNKLNFKEQLNYIRNCIEKKHLPHHIFLEYVELINLSKNYKELYSSLEMLLTFLKDFKLDKKSVDFFELQSKGEIIRQAIDRLVDSCSLQQLTKLKSILDKLNSKQPLVDRLSSSLQKINEIKKKRIKKLKKKITKYVFVVTAFIVLLFLVISYKKEIRFFTNIIWRESKLIVEKVPCLIAKSKEGFVTSWKLNIRQGPGTKYKVIGTLSKGEKVIILKKYKNWYQICFNGKKGWVYGKYIIIKMAR